MSSRTSDARAMAVAPNGEGGGLCEEGPPLTAKTVHRHTSSGAGTMPEPVREEQLETLATSLHLIASQGKPDGRGVIAQVAERSANRQK